MLESNDDDNVSEKDEELAHLKKSLAAAEEQAVLKDQQISQLTSRMREYELGEYGLSQAVSEIKDCKRVIRARDREIEKLTEELNFSKFQVSELLEKKNQFQSNLMKPLVYASPLHHTNNQVPEMESGKETLIPKKKSPVPITVKQSKPISSDDKVSTYIQNEKLRSELQDVCETAMQFAAQIQKHSGKDFLDDKYILKTIKERDCSCVHLNGKKVPAKVFPPTSISYDNEHFIKFAMDLIEKEDASVQKIFHQLMNEVKILKHNQSILIRRYIMLYDNNFDLRKQNQRMQRKLLMTSQNNSEEIKLSLENITNRKSQNRSECFLQEINALDDGDICNRQSCSVRLNKIRQIGELGRKVCENNSVLGQLLEISRQQTRALEAIVFSQEVQINALQELLLVFQTQSDESMLLGKLATKVLQLQFTQAAYAGELKKYKLNKKSSEKLLAEIKQMLRENEVSSSVDYLMSLEKGRKLGEVLRDLCCRCNTAVATLLNQSDPQS